MNPKLTSLPQNIEPLIVKMMKTLTYYKNVIDKVKRYKTLIRKLKEEKLISFDRRRCPWDNEEFGWVISHGDDHIQSKGFISIRIPCISKMSLNAHFQEPLDSRFLFILDDEEFDGYDDIDIPLEWVDDPSNVSLDSILVILENKLKE